MATIEERLTALEQEHATLREKIELQTIAIGALVNKAALEKLNEKYDKIFEALASHDRLTNERLGDLQTQVIELDGKTVGLQTEMRQSFKDVDARFETMATKDGLSAMNAHFDARFEQITLILKTLTDKP